MSCEQHKMVVEKYSGGSLQDLATDIGDLHYEALVTFLAHLSHKIEFDAMRDSEGGRPKLASELLFAARSLEDATKSITKALFISEPFMK